jgi:hypothetical protein
MPVGSTGGWCADAMGLGGYLGEVPAADLIGGGPLSDALNAPVAPVAQPGPHTAEPTSPGGLSNGGFGNL